MRKIVESLLILTFLASSAVAQKATEACRADMKHLKLPEKAFIDDVLGLNQPTLLFLFSQDGVDVYSATDFKAMRMFQRTGMPFANAFTVVLVYQDEQMRQRKIESLLKENPHAPFEDLKFATLRYELTPVWDDNVLKRKWLIAGMAYFKPVSCEPMESRMPASSEGYLEATIQGNNRIAGQMPPIAIPESQRLPPTPDSVLAKALDAMRNLLKSYGLPN